MLVGCASDTFLSGGQQTARDAVDRGLIGRPLAGQVIKVEVPPHYSTTVEFANGTLATLLMSFDTLRGPALPRIALYGSEGALEISEPNTFDGESILYRHPDGQAGPLTSGHRAERGRGSGVADMAYLILRPGRVFRPTGELAQHILEIMKAANLSSTNGRRIHLTTVCPQPDTLPEALFPDVLDSESMNIRALLFQGGSIGHQPKEYSDFLRTNFPPAAFRWKSATPSPTSTMRFGWRHLTSTCRF